MLANAATQCLLLSGFFARQMAHRHSLRWYSDLGGGFFRRAGLLARERRRGELLDHLGRHFEPWRERCARLSDELRDAAYVLHVH